MSDLIENQITGINEPEFSVSEISNAIKRLIEDEFSYVRIRGLWNPEGSVSTPRALKRSRAKTIRNMSKSASFKI